jgi:alpha-mannosidase
LWSSVKWTVGQRFETPTVNNETIPDTPLFSRRLLYDDSRGVGEALNETVCNSNGECEGLTVQGSFSVYIGPSEQSAQWRRVYGQQVLMPLQFAFSVLEDGNEAAIRSPQFSAMQPFYELPPNVAIITLQEVYEDDDSKVLLRLANIFEVGDTQQTPLRLTVIVFPSLV